MIQKKKKQKKKKNEKEKEITNVTYQKNKMLLGWDVEHGSKSWYLLLTRGVLSPIGLSILDWYWMIRKIF